MPWGARSPSVPCPAFWALLPSRNVTDLQRNSAVRRAAHRELPGGREELGGTAAQAPVHHLHRRLSRDHRPIRSGKAARAPPRDGRSEEHTSELQSQSNLV